MVGVFGVAGCPSPRKFLFARLNAKELTSARCGLALHNTSVASAHFKAIVVPRIYCPNGYRATIEPLQLVKWTGDTI